MGLSTLTNAPTRSPRIKCQRPGPLSLRLSPRCWPLLSRYPASGTRKIIKYLNTTSRICSLSARTWCLPGRFIRVTMSRSNSLDNSWHRSRINLKISPKSQKPIVFTNQTSTKFHRPTNCKLKLTKLPNHPWIRSISRRIKNWLGN